MAPTRENIALAKIDAALQKIEAAQVLVERACRDISNITGGTAQCGRLLKLHVAIKEEWYRLSAARKKLGAKGIDREPDLKWDAAFWPAPSPSSEPK